MASWLLSLKVAAPQPVTAFTFQISVSVTQRDCTFSLIISASEMGAVNFDAGASNTGMILFNNLK